MNHQLKSLIICTISALFFMFAIIFYRYTKANLVQVDAQIASINNSISQLSQVKPKIQALSAQIPLIHKIDLNVRTNFDISLSENSLQKLIAQIDNLYKSNTVIVNNATISAQNNTLNCTMSGFKVGL